MIKAAITALKERNGSSRQAIKKYITEQYKVGAQGQGQINKAIHKGVQAGLFVQPKGAAGKVKLAVAGKGAAKSEGKPKAAKPKKASTTKAAKPKKASKPKAAKKAAGDAAPKPKKASTKGSKVAKPKKASKPKAAAAKTAKPKKAAKPKAAPAPVAAS
jgi:histone H1/5